ncbi:MAG TPA: hypothetical protein VGC67_13605 [Cellulomonas sp.]
MTSDVLHGVFGLDLSPRRRMTSTVLGALKRSPITARQLLGTVALETDETESHIEADQDAARTAGVGPLLVRICPAHVCSLRPDGRIGVAYRACLECGTGLVVAPRGTLSRHYHRGGTGMGVREG